MNDFELGMDAIKAGSWDFWAADDPENAPGKLHPVGTLDELWNCVLRYFDGWPPGTDRERRAMLRHFLELPASIPMPASLRAEVDRFLLTS